MHFRKYHGIGNDFVMLDDLEGRLGPAGSLDPQLVRVVCDRNTGIGADGVIRVLQDAETEAAGAALRMDYYNADGGAAEMCGNGIRCLAVLAHRDGLLDLGEHAILTGGGVRAVRLYADGLVTVDMGKPSLDRPDVPMSGEGSALRVGLETEDGTTVQGTGVSMGNPHFVLFTEDLGREMTDELVRGLGPELEHHAAFPDRANVEFVSVQADGSLRTRVWERGVGETRACGTGACAVAVAASSLDRAGREVDVQLPGGRLHVAWGDDDHVWMTGPAEEVFSGRLARGWLDARGVEIPETSEVGA